MVAPPRHPRPIPSAALCLILGACASFPDLDERAAFKSPRRGVVVTEEQVASEVGQRILEQGGNAVDAAVAAAFALAVTFPEAGNLGGGGFAIYVPHDPQAEPLAVDFRETAPAELSPEAFLDEEGQLDADRATSSALSVGVPGSVAGLHLLHSQAGRLSWRDVVAPAVGHARVGIIGANLQWRLNQPGMRQRIEAGGGGETYYPGGELPAQTASFPQRALAETLDRIAQRGPDGFYRGPTAQAIVAEVERRGGVMTLADLAGYRAKLREPLRGWFRGKEIVTMPPPSSGGGGPAPGPVDPGRLPPWTRSASRPWPPARGRRPRSASPGGRCTGGSKPCGPPSRTAPSTWRDPRLPPGPDAEALLSPDWIATHAALSIGERANPGVRSHAGPGRPRRGHRHDPPGGPRLRRQTRVSLTTTLNSNFGSGIYVGAAGFSSEQRAGRLRPGGRRAQPVRPGGQRGPTPWSPASGPCPR